MTITKYKRRTFKDVASAAHATGYAEGLEQGRKEAQEKYNALIETNLELGWSVMAAENKLAAVSLRKLAWSRITGLFRNRDDRMA